MIWIMFHEFWGCRNGWRRVEEGMGGRVMGDDGMGILMNIEHEV